MAFIRLSKFGIKNAVLRNQEKAEKIERFFEDIPQQEESLLSCYQNTISNNLSTHTEFITIPISLLLSPST